MIMLSAVKGVTAKFGRRPVTAFHLALGHAQTVLPRPLGLREVAVSRIVGSVGRWHELAEDFRPLRWRPDKVDDERYAGILRALQRGLTLPPISVYLLDGAYYVLDGHHRVAAAKALGQVFVDAEVTEYLQPVRSLGVPTVKRALEVASTEHTNGSSGARAA
ncbi:MAG TPA: ParB/RepB/Spo0J family partition protein [Chloroflexota bacterium]|jgi:hypothetical protein